MNGCGEHFVRLVEAIDGMGIEQHVIVRNHSLAKRVAIYDGVTTGPCTGSAVMAYGLMPRVRLAHVHDDVAGQSGLLLTLTRSIPFVITRRDRRALGSSPLLRSIYSRAACIIANSAEAAQSAQPVKPAALIEEIADISHEDKDRLSSERCAAEHIRVYRRAVDRCSVPALML
jgi:hypothetical protein